MRDGSVCCRGGDARPVSDEQMYQHLSRLEERKTKTGYPARMEAVGFGGARRTASNATGSGRAKNRVTEFNIVEH